MPLGGVHFLLTYRCERECDHCFLFGGPTARGTFRLAGLHDALEAVAEVPTVETVFFEGGEPFLYYPVLVEGVRLAAEKGFSTGTVTNGFWATSPEDAVLWLRPLKDAGLGSLCLSDDPLHYPQEEGAHAENARQAAERLGLSLSVFVTEEPRLEEGEDGRPVVEGSVMFRGRAAERLVEGLPRCPADEFTECPFEDLADPGRVHLDAFGNLHLCQGLLMGNARQTALAEVVAGYDPAGHPVVGPLLEGGPLELARRYEVPCADGYVDACHLCYEARKALRGRFPEHLGPSQVYGP
jgi:hypothetical protein